MSLAERLDKIKSPKLQNQRETAVVLSAIEDTLKDQNQEFTPTGYFAALLALLNQALTASNGIVNKELATSVVYLLDIVTTHVPLGLLRSKVTQILTSLDPALTQQDADAPLIRPAIGCLESLLIAQDAAAWALPQTQVGARRAVARLLGLSLDHRPKIRKRAQEALAKILQQPPPSPSVDHPATDMCASTALHSLNQIVQDTAKRLQKFRSDDHHPALIHALQLVKTIAAASGGWPAKRLDALSELVLEIAKSNNEYLAIASFEVFEAVFSGLADEISSSKIPRLLEVIMELKPSQNDAQLLPPWIAVISRGYDVSAQVNPEETFAKLPEVFEMVSGFLASMSHNIRESASECLISFCANCIPSDVILKPSVFDEKTLEKLGKLALDLLSIKFQSAWMEVFQVFSALFEALKWRASPMLDEVVKTVGELRGSDSFTGKTEADAVIGKAVEAIGPEALLSILPLNLINPKDGQPGRAWLLPIFRDNVINTRVAHFKSEFVPLSETIQQRVRSLSKGEKTMEVKVYETVIAQIWSLLPGYFTLPLDAVESFDAEFAEQVSKMLYENPEMRVDLCRALQVIVETNSEVANIPADETDLILQRRISQDMAEKNVKHLSTMASSMLAVLFNIYSRTLPQYRGHVLQCINAYLGIIPKPELEGAFSEVASQLESELAKEAPQTQADKQKASQSAEKMPPTSHALMDLIITMAIYLPRSSFSALWGMAKTVLPRSSDPQLQKKAYKLLPRLENSETGVEALTQNNAELQAILLENTSTSTIPARRDRLAAFTTIVNHMPPETLHFIPSILSEVVISAKETNEKARTAAFDLLILMGHKMAEGGAIDRTKIPHMGSDAGTGEASLEEYLTMLSAGLAGSTPHMISAGVTALARVSYEFHEQLPEQALAGLVEVMNLLLDHNNREVVRAVLGFQKVAAVSFPESLLQPHLPQLVPALTHWSHEHKARLRVKVKSIFDRLIRRLGFDVVDAHCPEADRKLLVNIRKRRERAKRKKEAAKAGATDGETPEQQPRRGGAAFASEFERALHDSDDGSGSDSDASVIDGDASSDDNGGAPRRTKHTSRTFILDNDADDEPLDLLDRRALGHLSSTRPVSLRQRQPKPRAVRVDLDGKLVLGDAGNDAMEVDAAEEKSSGGVDAYVAAIRGRDAAQRGRGGRIKFKNRRETGKEDEDDEMEDAEGLEVVAEAATRGARNVNGRGRDRRGSGAGTGVGWERKKAKFGAPRRGLEQPKGGAWNGGGGGGGERRRGGDRRGGRARGVSGRGGIVGGRRGKR